MRRPLTETERQTLLANPELVMFVPQHRGITPVTFLLVVPVITGITLVGLFLAFGLFSDFVEAAPVASSLTFIAVCVISSFVFMFLKDWYDQAFGFNRELRQLLAGSVAVEKARVTGFLPQKAEIYLEADGKPSAYCVFSAIHVFLPEQGTEIALLYSNNTCLVVQPSPQTQSLLA